MADLLTPSQVAHTFGVDRKTVVRWADTGKLSSIRTLGGHRRFDAEEVAGLLEATQRKRTSRYAEPLQRVLETGTSL